MHLLISKVLLQKIFAALQCIGMFENDYTVSSHSLVGYLRFDVPGKPVNVDFEI
jgi:hypothetical protein